MATILIVDDDLTHQLVVFKILKKIGFNIIFADDGEQALEQVQRHCPDLVILDVILPKINGYEVCRRLKSCTKNQKLAVLMCSNKTEDCDHYWGMKQGADAYISKPCHPQDLISIVQYLLQEVVRSTCIPKIRRESISISCPKGCTPSTSGWQPQTLNG